MLFIFRVDVGVMINLDMNLALETVAHLKTALYNYCNIPVEKQVLLISGGESLEEKERVCKYTAGSSDTNPIFLFSVSTLEGQSPPVFTDTSDTLADRDLQPEVETSLNLPDTHNTVAVRASLAQEYVKVSQHQARLCENEIHAQHLQHQGWAAALANLEDSVLALEKRKNSFEEAYNRYLLKRDHYKMVIETFDDDIHILSKIPVLNALTASGSESINGSAAEGKLATSLLDWINQAGNSSLEQVADSCYRSLEQLDPPFLDNIKGKVSNCVEAANNQQMKEIRGLGDRLSGLEQLLLEANKKVTEQKDLANAFLQNQERASGLRDASILPDLCTSHKQQLLVMMRNHQHIVSIRKRCVKAKEELSLNLYTRLKWVMFIQRQMAESGQQLLLYYEELKRLSRRLEVMEQLHLAPSMYLATVVEVVRRKSFSDHFMRKSSVLASNFTNIFTEEVKTRQIFQDKLNKHFLATMFPGMEDMPPPFATTEPEPFDQKLPSITLADLELLRCQVPELAQSLSVPDRKTLSSLLTKSLTQDLTKEEDDAMQNLHNLTNKISIEGDGLGSVSVMNRICYDAITRKKSRLEALAQSRERTLGSDTDSEDEGEVVKKGKTKVQRKMTRSLPGKTSSLTAATTSNGTSSSHKKKQSVTSAAAHQEAITNTVTSVADTSLNGDVVSSSSVDPSSSTANTNSSAAPSSDGSLMKQKWCSQTQVDEKGQVLGGAGEERMNGLLNVTNAGLQDLRDQLELVRNQVESEKATLLDSVRETTERLISSLNKYDDNQKNSDCSSKEFNQLREAKKLAEEQLAVCRQNLETEQNKLEDCNREIEMYRYQLQEVTRALDNLQAEVAEERSELEDRLTQQRSQLESRLIEEKSQLENRLQEAFENHRKEIQEMEASHCQERKDLQQKLELEHELELDQIKQTSRTNNDENGDSENEVIKLKSEMSEKARQVRELEAKLELLEITGEERIKEEKDKIVKILEAGFTERQRLALHQLETKLKQEHDTHVADIKEKDKEEMCSRLEELRQKMIETSQTNLDRVVEKKEKEWENKMKKREDQLIDEFNQERLSMEASKLKEIEENFEKVRKTSKMEMDSLRSRFKMMQHTSNVVLMDRSPSISESELSFENRIDPVGSPKSEEKSSLELNNEVETLKRRIREMEEANRTGMEGGKNGAFAAKLNGDDLNSSKLLLEKEKRIFELEEELRQRATQAVPAEGSQQKAADLEKYLSQLGQQKLQLEADLKEKEQLLSSVNQQLTTSMQASIRVDSFENIKQLQEENRLLRNQLTLSMTSLISTGKVSVSSVEVGEVVLVVWSQPHSHYSIYHEGRSLHFLHSDSVEALGLGDQEAKPYITAEVVEKEYCQARKPTNRFKVANGTKFYRVKCKPVTRAETINK